MASSNQYSSVEEGYRFFMNNAAFFKGVAHTVSHNGAYISDIDSKIQQLKWIINASPMRLDGDISKATTGHGFTAEYWHGYTYRIAQAAKRTQSWVKVEDSPEARSILGGPDITSEWDEQFSLKFYDKARRSADAQAATKYVGQTRLIPSDQLEDAKRALQKRIDKLLVEGGTTDSEEVNLLIETRDRLTDHIEGPNGEQSFPLSYEQSLEIRKLANEGKFDPAEYDITSAKIADRAILINNAVKAGLNAAWTTALLKIAPALFSCIKEAIDGGQITNKDLLNIGEEGIEGFSLGFLRGTMIAGITTAAELGFLGEKIKEASLSPEFSSGIAVLVSTAMSIASDGILLAKHEITKEEFCFRSERTIFIASASYICGVTVQGLLIEFPMAGYLIGSFMGSLIGGALFSVKEKFFMSICVEKGWQFFGLVDQNYTLPDSILKEIGFDVVEYDNADNYEESIPDDLEIDMSTIDECSFDSLDFTLIRRSVIGIRKVGYITI